MADQKLTLRLELENGQFVGNLRVSGKAVDRFTDRLGDYPRACGETSTVLSTGVAIMGLSPRLRGNRPVQGHESARVGTIPAPAGKPRPAIQ